MNWGHKLTLVIIAFILCMLGMVFIAFRQTNGMIDTNYYEKELNYQSLIDAAQNLNAVSNDDLIKQNEKGLLITIPLSLLAGFENGRAEFLKIDNQKGDAILSFKPDSDGLFLIENSKILHGSYKVRLKWKSQSKDYYREQNLLVE
ncbi:MAG: FixH family protein [Bacteroidia bacterium]